MRILRRSSRRFVSRLDYTYPQRAPNLRVTQRAELATTGTAPDKRHQESSDRKDR
jgi:hypothetical protein